jgi:hypothetical protein
MSALLHHHARDAHTEEQRQAAARLLMEEAMEPPRPDMGDLHDWHAREDARAAARDDLLAYHDMIHRGERIARAIGRAALALLLAAVVMAVLAVVEVM